MIASPAGLKEPPVCWLLGQAEPWCSVPCTTSMPLIHSTMSISPPAAQPPYGLLVEASKMLATVPALPRKLDASFHSAVGELGVAEVEFGPRCTGCFAVGPQCAVARLPRTNSRGCPCKTATRCCPTLGCRTETHLRTGGSTSSDQGLIHQTHLTKPNGRIGPGKRHTAKRSCPQHAPELAMRNQTFSNSEHNPSNSTRFRWIQSQFKGVFENQAPRAEPNPRLC